MCGRVEIRGISDWPTTYGAVTESRLISPRRAQSIYRYQHPKYRNLDPFDACGIMPGQPTVRIAGSGWGGRTSRLQSCREQALEFDDPARAQALVDRYPVGAVVQVYLDDHAVLEAEPYGEPWWKWIGGGLATMLVGILLLVVLGRGGAATVTYPGT